MNQRNNILIVDGDYNALDWIRESIISLNEKNNKVRKDLINRRIAALNGNEIDIGENISNFESEVDAEICRRMLYQDAVSFYNSIDKYSTIFEDVNVAGSLMWAFSRMFDYTGVIVANAYPNVSLYSSRNECTEPTGFLLGNVAMRMAIPVVFYTWPDQRQEREYGSCIGEISDFCSSRNVLLLELNSRDEDTFNEIYFHAVRLSLGVQEGAYNIGINGVSRGNNDKTLFNLDDRLERIFNRRYHTTNEEGVREIKSLNIG